MPIICCLTAHPGFRPLLRNSRHFAFQQQLRKPTSCWVAPSIFPPSTSCHISEVTSVSTLGRSSLHPLFFYCFFSHLFHTVLPGPLQLHSPWHTKCTFLLILPFWIPFSLQSPCKFVHSKISPRALQKVSSDSGHFLSHWKKFISNTGHLELSDVCLVLYGDIVFLTCNMWDCLCVTCNV